MAPQGLRRERRNQDEGQESNGIDYGGSNLYDANLYLRRSRILVFLSTVYLAGKDPRKHYEGIERCIPIWVCV